MNKVILMGRLTRDPEINRTQNDLCIARYSLAVDRRYKKDEGQDADFPSCVVFGKCAEFAEKYLRKGTKIALTGRLETGSYTNKDGVKVYTTTVVVEEQEFAESRAASQNREREEGQDTGSAASARDDKFMTLDDAEDLPF